jgi:hypothetical protein
MTLYIWSIALVCLFLNVTNLYISDNHQFYVVAYVLSGSTYYMSAMYSDVSATISSTCVVSSVWIFSFIFIYFWASECHHNLVCRTTNVHFLIYILYHVVWDNNHNVQRIFGLVANLFNNMRQAQPV